MTNRIYIPTYGRVGNQRTYSWLTPELRERTVLVAPAGDAEALDLLGFPVLVCDEKGISNTRQWVLDQHDVDEFGPVLYMLDDDLRFAMRRIDDPSKFEPLPPADPRVGDLFDDMDDVMEHVALGGITYRGGANRVVEPYLMNSRIFSAWGVDVGVLRREGIKVNRLPFQEDFDLQLQLLTRGYPSLRLNTYTWDQSASNAEGGCSTTRTSERQAASCMQLWENFPDFVSVRETKGWRGMGDKRIDVTVQWKRAYESGKAFREVMGLDPIPEPNLALLF